MCIVPITIFNHTKQTVVATQVCIADTFWSRLQGLIGRSSLAQGEGLLITHCQSIHMFFMQFPIDAVFLSSENVVVGLVHNIKPYQLSPLFFKSSSCLELPSGTIIEKNISIGDCLQKR